ncbi:MAG: hypothetical protein COA80_14475 [Leeuwenhoekiella sp.]|nr:MAG: hypothetical protein COA80_14475 [Leeuwenhoekiella sp.]
MIEEYLCVDDAKVAEIPAGTIWIRTLYYHDPSSDSAKLVGGALYRQVDSAAILGFTNTYNPVGGSTVTSYWEIYSEGEAITIEQAGWFSSNALLDNMKAIQSAVVFASTRKLIVDFPAGIVPLDGYKGNQATFSASRLGGIYMDGGYVHLRGRGIDATILRNEADDWRSMIFCRGGDALIVENLTIDGNWPEKTTPLPAQAAIRGEGIILGQATGPLGALTVQNVKITRTGHYGIGVQNIAVDTILIDNLIGKNVGGDLIDIKDFSSLPKKSATISNVFSEYHGLNPDAAAASAALDIRGEGFELVNIRVVFESYVDTGNTGIRFNSEVDAHNLRKGGRKSKLSNFVVRSSMALESRTEANGACTGLAVYDEFVACSNGLVESCARGILVAQVADSIPTDICLEGVTVADARDVAGTGYGIRLGSGTKDVVLSAIVYDSDLGFSSNAQAVMGDMVLRQNTVGHNVSPQVMNFHTLRIFNQNNDADVALGSADYFLSQKPIRTPGIFTPLNMPATHYITDNSWLGSNTAGVDGNWNSVCWSAELGLFCAVGLTDGASPQIMSSPDGRVWTARTAPNAIDWRSVCWSSERRIFCAVASSGTGHRVMTSADGTTWTVQASPADHSWISVIWATELGQFVAVASAASVTAEKVMTSPDGIQWTIQNAANNNAWYAVAWSGLRGLLVAVANNGTSDRIMTSPDGINWTSRASPADLSWQSVCYAPRLGLFVAAAVSGTGNRIMTSPDGVNWTLRASAADHSWSAVCYAPELNLLVAVSFSGAVGRVMTSADGIIWTSRISPVSSNWRAVCWSPETGIFCAVGNSGTATRVMTSVQAEGAKNNIRRPGLSGVQAITTEASFTLTSHIDQATILHTAMLTADRMATLASFNAAAGDCFRITRSGGGNFKLSIGGLRHLETGDWCEVIYSGAAWYLAAAGTTDEVPD